VPLHKFRLLTSGKAMKRSCKTSRSSSNGTFGCQS
jgi:hypothetical protein